MFQEVYGKNAEKHAERTGIENLSQEYIDLMDKFKSKTEFDRILDIGCAVGRDLRYLMDGEDNSLGVGLDASPRMIELAREKNTFNNLRFVTGDAKRLPFSSNSFDLITQQATIFLLGWNGMEQSINEMRRVMKPDGVCWVSFKVSDGKFSGSGTVTRERWGEEVEYYFVDPEEARELVRGGCFEIQEEVYTGFKETEFISLFLTAEDE